MYIRGPGLVVGLTKVDSEQQKILDKRNESKMPEENERLQNAHGTHDNKTTRAIHSTMIGLILRQENLGVKIHTKANWILVVEARLFCLAQNIAGQR